ncbi:hypothetical protein [Paenibacillus eucommiae]|uniref:Uncharacterized protein n=1 Tax=Paenibacillus eucommiae TaxID=1355755 RepID=A0ABS4JAG3_9BACL|nr:hypothetical protein [Paenibacillus eucommiae]MBP1996829.1 hypothetical protein [Paenibacillus eucommiae]
MQNQTLQAAFRKVKITPEEPAPLQGYDPNVYVAYPEKDIMDDLFARVLVLDDGDKRHVLVSVDCCLTNEVTFQAADPSGELWKYRHFLQTFPEGTREKWGKTAGAAESAVSVHATHTHSAPEHFSEKYTLRIDRAIQEAVDDLQPVRIRAASGDCGISVNRRPNLQHNDRLPIDKALNVIVFETYDGKSLGGIVNCAVHPTLLMNPLNRVSTEFVGLAMNEWEDEVGAGFVSLFIQGFLGDVGPVDHYRTETYDTYPWVKEMGHELFQAITKITGNLQGIAELPLISLEKKVSLPTKHGYFKPFIDVTLHGVRMGEVVIFSASAEVFNGYVGLIEPHSPAAFTLFSGVANGYCGYLPTPEAFGDELGGYEMNTTPYKLESCDLFIQSAVELAQGLR